jgi:sec-independent protein translocase protein TatA
MNTFLIVGLWDSPQEIGLILIVILILFGSKKLPEMARNLGKSVEQFKKAANSVRNEVLNADQDEPPKPALPASTEPQTFQQHEGEIAGQTPPVENTGHTEESKTEVTLNVSPTPPADTVSQNDTHAEKTA